MAHRSRLSLIIPALFAVALACGLTPTGMAQDAPGPTAEVRQPNGASTVQARTSLTDLLFSAEGGVLTSAYVHFSPLQTFIFPSPWPPVEVIADTSVESEEGDLERSYTDDARFPFELIIGGESTQDLSHDVDVDRAGDETVVTFTAERNGLRIVKTFTLTNNPYYRFRTDVVLENTSDALIDLQQGLRLSLGSGVGTDPDVDDQAHFLVDGEVTDDPDSDPLEGFGFEAQYLTLFVFGLSPEDDWQAVETDQTLQAQISPLRLAPGESRSFEFRTIAGRTKHMLLRDNGLEELAPPGFFGQFVVYVSEMLSWFYAWTGNFGWAIILFTLVTRIILFPLMRKQFHSMSAMTELRPKMEKLQQRYPTRKKLQELHPNMSQEEIMKRDRENRQQLQQKMMEMYREEGVNPLGGCLPLVVQMPILLLLYRAIIENAEAIHLSPGFLWMPDLAMQDPTWIIMILTVGTLVLQSKTNPMQASSPQSAGQQNMMMIFMGGFMLLALHNFPAGLWLYYFLTNVVQVSQQVFVRWEINQQKAAKAAREAAAPTEGTEATAIDPERLDETPEMPEADAPNDAESDTDAESDRPS